MVITLQELQMYKNFDELANDVLDLAKEILPDKLIYLTSFSDKEQIILKLSTMDTNILLTEGMVINLNETVCNRIDFKSEQPLVYEDIRDGMCSIDLRNILEEVHIKSYLGVPISLVNGEKFGTLCVAHDEESHFDKKSINLLQKIARMFSYYLGLEYFAYRDALTGLYNRHYLSKFFEDHSKTGGVLFFLDLDGFKQVNDTHGHDTGDLVLKEVASKLQKVVSEHKEAFAVRLGGDEFILHFSQLSNKEELSERAERVLNRLSTWGSKYQLSTSIGVVAYPVDCNTNLITLLKNADTALYSAKTAGKNCYKLF